MTELDRTRHQRLFWSVLAVYVVTWVWISWMTSPSLDPYGDMVENYAWSQTPAWGTFKHPPLFAWMVGAWFTLFPTEVPAYYLLSYVNAGVGLLGIVALGRLWLPDDLSPGRRDAFAMLVLVCAGVSFPYANLAAKFNADTVLLSLWPWTAYACVASMRASGAREQASYGAMLGVMAAAAMLGKYFSILLLATLTVISLSHAAFRRWYRTPAPYVAALVASMLALPHLRWEIRMGFPFWEYLETKIDPAIDVGRILVFVASGIYYLPLSWLVWLWARGRLTATVERPVTLALPLRGLVLLTLLPAAMTAASSVIARVHLTTHWAIPVWFGLPVLLAVRLLPRLADDFAWARLSRALAATWGVLLVGGSVYALVLSVTGNPKYSLARPEMVETIVRRFGERVRDRPLSWAGGSWPESGALAFFADNHPRALPGLPDERRAMANPYDEWRRRDGVILCYASGEYARAGTHDVDCERETREWLRAHGLPIAEETLRYRAKGWRFRTVQEKNVTVFWVPPASAVARREHELRFGQPTAP